MYTISEEESEQDKCNNHLLNTTIEEYNRMFDQTSKERRVYMESEVKDSGIIWTIEDLELGIPIIKMIENENVSLIRFEINLLKNFFIKSLENIPNCNPKHPDFNPEFDPEFEYNCLLFVFINSSEQSIVKIFEDFYVNKKVSQETNNDVKEFLKILENFHRIEYISKEIQHTHCYVPDVPSFYFLSESDASLDNVPLGAGIRTIKFLKYEDNKPLREDTGAYIIRQESKDNPLYLVVDKNGSPIKDRGELEALEFAIKNVLDTSLKKNPMESGLNLITFTALTTVLVQKSLLEKNQGQSVESAIRFSIGDSIIDDSKKLVSRKNFFKQLRENNRHGEIIASFGCRENLLKGNPKDGVGHFLTTLYDSTDNPEQFFEPSGASIFDNNLLNPDRFPQEGDTCGYWTAFFCAEAIKYDSIQEIKDNFDEILLKTAARVSEFIDQKPVILFEKPIDTINMRLYKEYNYSNDNPPKSVFMLIDNKKVTL